MKAKTIYKILIGVLMASPVFATSTGNQSLGSSTTRMDIFRFVCPSNPDRRAGRGHVFDTLGTNNTAAKVRLMLIQGGLVCQTEDGGEDNLTTPSPSCALTGGVSSLFYYAVFFKTAPGTESYNGFLSCFNPQTGGVFNPALTRTVNQ